MKNKDKPQHTEMTLPKCIDLFSPKTFFSKTVVQLLLPASIMFALFFPEITALSVIGGVDIKDTVWRIMKHLFTNSLAKQLNWRGVNGKTAFHSLQLKDVITGKC